MAAKILLSKEQVDELIRENSYKIEDSSKLISRCVDGRYENSLDLPPLAIAGADAGELFLIQSTANQYGFEMDLAKTIKTLEEVVGGVKNLRFHTDTHADNSVTAAGCGHIGQIRKDPQAYNIHDDQVSTLQEQLNNLEKQGAKNVLLKGDHMEGAALLIRGNYSVKTQYAVRTDQGDVAVQVFVAQQTLVNERHRVLAQKLIENKAVTLIDNLDAEYLYEVLSTTTEDHLLETLKRLAPGLPLYEVSFGESGQFKLEDLGRIQA